MTGEGKNCDYKIDYRPLEPRARLRLVKDLVALANTGGGEITFGRNEIVSPGVDEATAKALDSAALANLVESFIKPASIDLRHETSVLENGKYFCVVRISPAEYPIVIARSGNYADTDGKQRSEFEPGDIWTRHSSKTEKVSYEDVRRWIEAAKQIEREKLLSRITTLVNLPEDAEIQVVAASPAPIDSPKRLLESATIRRAHDRNHLLSGDDLAYLFANRQFFEMTDEELATIIGSSLRRNATLYWWLIRADNTPDMIIGELNRCLEASDRDRSDAARSIIELAAIYSDDAQLINILAELSQSRYKHFRDAASEWVDRATQLHAIGERMAGAKHDGQLLFDRTEHELEELATAVALELVPKGSPALARRLGDVTRVLWGKRSFHAGLVRISATNPLRANGEAGM